MTIGAKHDEKALFADWKPVLARERVEWLMAQGQALFPDRLVADIQIGGESLLASGW